MDKLLFLIVLICEPVFIQENRISMHKQEISYLKNKTNPDIYIIFSSDGSYVLKLTNLKKDQLFFF